MKLDRSIKIESLNPQSWGHRVSSNGLTLLTWINGSLCDCDCGVGLNQTPPNSDDDGGHSPCAESALIFHDDR